MDPFPAAQNPPGFFPDFRIQMNRVDDLNILKPVREIPDRRKNIFHIFAQIFSSVAGDRNHAPTGEIDIFQSVILKFVRLARYFQERVDDGIAGHENILEADPFAQQILPVPLGRREMHRRDIRSQHPVHFLRKR